MSARAGGQWLSAGHPGVVDPLGETPAGSAVSTSRCRSAGGRRTEVRAPAGGCGQGAGTRAPVQAVVVVVGSWGRRPGTPEGQHTGAGLRGQGVAADPSR